MEMDYVTKMLHQNMMQCWKNVCEAIRYCDELMANNNVIMLVDPPMYHDLKLLYGSFLQVKEEMDQVDADPASKGAGTFLSVTGRGAAMVAEINRISDQIESKWKGNEIDVQKYLFAQNLLALDFGEKAVLDIDDLNMALQSPNRWISAYAVEEVGRKKIHCAAWESKVDALSFILQTSFGRRSHIFNRLAGTPPASLQK